MNATTTPAMGMGMGMGMGMSTGMQSMTGMYGTYAMTREASGTAWQPQSTPFEGIMVMDDGWMLMLHGYDDVVFDHQGGPRGADKTFDEGMLMGMASHSLGGGTVGFRAMLSPDPAMGPNGYPLLLQTGETANGVTPLIDRQHPHNLFMELATTYSHPLAAGTSAFVYFAYPGEPALGPVTFMHRFSGEDDPAAPITHHWLDSTHITFGVATAGVIWRDWKLEGSVFTGREPDQHRWGFNPPRFDSQSVRLTYNPSPNWSMQISEGWLTSPEQLTPNVNQQRTTASVTYNLPFGTSNWQTTFAWGRNVDTPGHTLDGFLLESAIVLGHADTFFGRTEYVAKDELFTPLAEDLPTSGVLYGHVFNVAEATAGYIHDWQAVRHLKIGLGASVTADALPSALNATYGRTPVSFLVFARVKLD